MFRLDFDVTGSNRNLVTGLKADDFKLLDKGKSTNIATFQEFDAAAAPSEPVELIVVVDLADLDSLTSKRKGDAAKDAVEKFLRQQGGRLRYPTSVYALAREGLAGSAEPSRDGNALAEMIAMHRLPRRTRSPADTWFHIMPLQAEALGTIALEQRLRPARKILLWVGPGWAVKRGKDGRLFLGIVELFTRLREARIAVWGISESPYPGLQEGSGPSRHSEFAKRQDGGPSPAVDGRSQDYQGPAKDPGDARYESIALPVLAADTGGGMIVTKGIDEAIERCANRANAYYSITFNPARTSRVDEYHEIKLIVAKSGLTAHTFCGYYDEPAFYDQPPPAERLSVAELEAKLSSRNDDDRSISKELETVRLTERLSAKRFESLEQRLPGSTSREALEVVEDRSAFLPLPNSENLPDAPPDTTTQEQMLDRAASYVKESLARLPDLYAVRTTVHFNEAPIRATAGAWKQVSSDESLHVAQKVSTTVLVRNGRETADKRPPERLGEHDLLTVGTFGPILEIVLSRAEDSAMTWNHWEQGEHGPLAAFHYMSTKRSGGLHMNSCCEGSGVTSPTRAEAEFHGEVVIDPATGAVFRLTVEFNLKPGMPVSRSAVMVEYTPVTIGGKTYICPIHSVAISRQRIEWALHEWGVGFVAYGRYETLLNDTTFSHYHLFRSESTILTGGTTR